MKEEQYKRIHRFGRKNFKISKKKKAPDLKEVFQTHQMSRVSINSKNERKSTQKIKIFENGRCEKIKREIDKSSEINQVSQTNVQ